MKKKYYTHSLIGALFALCFFAGCSEKDEGPSMTVSSNSVSILASGEEQSIEITTNQAEWDATRPALDSWCTLKKEDNKLKISATTNETLMTRSTLVTIVSGSTQPQTVKVTQSAATPFVSITGDTPVKLDAAGTAAVLTINTNNDTWSAQAASDGTWCKLSQEGDKLTVSADVYAVKAERTTTVTVTSGTGATALTKTFEVIQQGAAPIYEIMIPTDFSTGSVQKVMNNNVKIAEICQEYIRIASTIDEQMVIAYPVVDGKTDLTNGFVIKNRGKIVWDLTTNKCTYTAGIEPALTKLYLDNGKLAASITATTPLPTRVEADLLIDTRPNDTKVSYKVVKVGTQYWMAENLKAQSYLDGTAIPMLTNSADWQANKTGAYRKPFSDNDTFLLYGAYYNGYAMYNAAGLAPEGWFVPANEDWTKLRNYIGTPHGTKLKSANILDWKSGSGTNITGFNAIGSGFYGPEDTGDGTDSFYWSTTKGLDFITKTNIPYYYRLTIGTSMPTDTHAFDFGHSIRCIRK